MSIMLKLEDRSIEYTMRYLVSKGTVEKEKKQRKAGRAKIGE